MAKPISFSFSKLEMYDSCPWAYRKIHLEKVPRADSEPLVIGRTLHETVAEYLKRLIAQNMQTDWDWAGKQDFLDVPGDVPEIWERFSNNFILPSPMDSPGVELQLAFNRAWIPTGFFDNDAYFRLVIDLTYRQGGLVVVQDWKSNRVVPGTIEKNLQLRIYGWGARRARYPDAQEILLRLHFLRYGAEREILLLPEDLDTVPQELEDKIAEIEAEKHFDPKPGSFCGWCGITAHCPVMAQALVPANIMYPVSREDATKAATLLLAIKTMEAEIKDHLKKFVKKVGPVQVGDIVYGPKPSTKYEFDPKEVTEYLINDCGLSNEDAWSLLKLGKTHLESSLKKLRRKDLIDPVLALAQTMPTESIEFFKVK